MFVRQIYQISTTTNKIKNIFSYLFRCERAARPYINHPIADNKYTYAMRSKLNKHLQFIAMV